MVVCVAVAVVVAVVKLEDVLGLYDSQADTNANLPYLERIHGDDGVVVNRAVVEDARALMPFDASYRVVVGPHMRSEGTFTRMMIAAYLRYYLVPRPQVKDPPADWVFCFGCDRAELGAGFEVLSDGGDGILFGRMRS